jgi:malate dehydrogenase
MAFAGARFAGSVLRGLNGDYNVECAYVESDVTSTPYFATPILLGVCILPLGNIVLIWAF